YEQQDGEHTEDECTEQTVEERLPAPFRVEVFDHDREHDSIVGRKQAFEHDEYDEYPRVLEQNSKIHENSSEKVDDKTKRAPDPGSVRGTDPVKVSGYNLMHCSMHRDFSVVTMH